jgi:hypothetical protein
MTNLNGGSLANDGTQGRRVPGASGLRPGQLFVENLKVVQEFHPVLLFGTQGSGKTHVLLSLLAYARYQSSMGVQTEFGCSSERDIFPVDYVATSGISHSERFINAKKMYDDEVQTFENGLDTAGTGIRDPFFIPINLIKGSEKTKLLFAEANGEWYQRGDDGLHKSFKEEINYMLLYYDKPMSIIFVVPSKQFETHNYNEMLNCITRTIEEYNRYDRARYGDNLLLLATKWDCIPGTKLPDGSGSDIELTEFEGQAERWTGVWANFCRIQALLPDSRAAMPYSTGPVNIVDDTRERRAGIYGGSSVYTQFPRILWNWLYENANQKLIDDKERQRKILFNDVAVEGMPKPTFYTRFITTVYGVGRR